MKANITENTPEETTFDLRLTLTRREAKAILTILDHVGGLTSGPRGVTDVLYETLYTITSPGKLANGGSLIFPATWEGLGK
jgi:hypothetical protein